jgi:hypothetical protein
MGESYGLGDVICGQPRDLTDISRVGGSPQLQNNHHPRCLCCLHYGLRPMDGTSAALKFRPLYCTRNIMIGVLNTNGSTCDSKATLFISETP